MNIQENVSLKPFTTFRVGGVASFFCDVENTDDLKKAFEFAKEKNLEVIILGGGSNTLFARDAVSGLVIRIRIPGIDFSVDGENIKARVGAGENWDEFVKLCVEKNYWGVENLSYIPGSVGAAPVQNIGAYGTELNQVVDSVEVFDSETLTITTLSNTECRFGYRTSLFKTNAGKRYVVTGVTFLLKMNGAPNLTYKDVSLYFKDRSTLPTLLEIREAVIAIRTRKLPDVKDVGTAGSFFKNPVVERVKYDELKLRFPEMVATIISDGLVKISAAWLLDVVGGFKGIKRGNVGVWDKQALVLVNFGDAKGAEVLVLAEEMQNKIQNETGIFLEQEVVVI